MNVRSAVTLSATLIRGMSMVATMMVVVHPNSGVLNMRETARTTQIVFLDWYAVAKTAQKIRGLVIEPTAVSSSLTYLTQVCLKSLFEHCNLLLILIICCYKIVIILQ